LTKAKNSYYSDSYYTLQDDPPVAEQDPLRSIIFF